MAGIRENLRVDLRDPEFSEEYAESFLNAFVATQIKVLREQHGLSQTDLARMLGTTQTAISRIENINYGAWAIATLKKVARIFRVRLKVSFETYGSLIDDVESFDRASLERTPRDNDAVLWSAETGPSASANRLAHQDVLTTANLVFDSTADVATSSGACRFGLVLGTAAKGQRDLLSVSSAFLEPVNTAPAAAEEPAAASAEYSYAMA